jgi:hypothetical protein
MSHPSHSSSNTITCADFLRKHINSINKNYGTFLDKIIALLSKSKLKKSSIKFSIVMLHGMLGCVQYYATYDKATLTKVLTKLESSDKIILNCLGGKHPDGSYPTLEHMLSSNINVQSWNENKDCLRSFSELEIVHSLLYNLWKSYAWSPDYNFYESGGNIFTPKTIIKDSSK